MTPGTGGQLANTALGVGANIAGRQVTNALQGSAARQGVNSVASKLGTTGVGTGAPAWASGAAGMGAGIGINMAGNALANKVRVNEDKETYGNNDEWYDLMGGYGRRHEGTGGGINSGAIRGATMGANPALAASTAGISVGVGALAGAIGAAATKNAPSAYTDYSAGDAARGIGDAYKQYLGRDGSDQEIMSQLQGQGFNQGRGDRWVGEKGLYSVLGSIRDSPEAKAYQAQLQGPQSPGAPPPPLPPQSSGTSAGASPQNPAGQAPTATSPGQSFSSFQGPSPDGPLANNPNTGVNGGRQGTPVQENQPPATPNRPTGLGQYAGSLEGFDGGKLNDPNKHDPKYDYGRVMSQFDPTKGLTPELLQQLTALGYGTASGQGDKLHIDGADPAFNGMTDIDVARDFGNGGWHWEDANGGGGQQAPSPQMPGGPMQFQGPQMGNDQGSYDKIMRYLMQQMGLDQAATQIGG